MALKDLLALPDISAALHCKPCPEQRRRVQTLKDDWAKTGRTPNSQDIIRQLGWDPELEIT